MDDIRVALAQIICPLGKLTDNVKSTGVTPNALPKRVELNDLDSIS